MDVTAAAGLAGGWGVADHGVVLIQCHLETTLGSLHVLRLQEEVHVRGL
jgi:hypothetical protein